MEQQEEEEEGGGSDESMSEVHTHTQLINSSSTQRGPTHLLTTRHCKKKNIPEVTESSLRIRAEPGVAPGVDSSRGSGSAPETADPNSQNIWKTFFIKVTAEMTYFKKHFAFCSTLQFITNI